MSFVVELDFTTKKLNESTVEEVQAAREAGRFCWVDLCGSDLDETDVLLPQIGIELPGQVLDEVEFLQSGFFDSEDFLGFIVSDVVLDREGIRIDHVQVIVTENLILTTHREESQIVNGVRTTFAKNFRQVALSPGFMLFEFADHLSHQYTHVLRMIAERTEEIEVALFNEVGDTIFAEVADLIRSILEFYKVIVFTRETLHDLATRRSPFIPETTQPYLEKKATLLDRLSSDVTAEREVLSETLNLYMGIVTHRTNKLVTRLTVISMLFLPLSFLVGVYGMNFEYMPELRSPYGYFWFWCFVVGLVSIMLSYMKRKGWL